MSHEIPGGTSFLSIEVGKKAREKGGANKYNNTLEEEDNSNMK